MLQIVISYAIFCLHFGEYSLSSVIQLLLFFFLISTEDGSWPLSAQEVFLRRPLVASLLGHKEPREQ